MSASVGDKFVIEIGEVFIGAESGKIRYRIKGFESLFFDEKGLEKLVPFNKDNRFGEGFQTAAVEYTKIINEITEAFNNLETMEDN